MSCLHDFYKKARYVAEKALEKTGEIMKDAALGIKIKAVEMRLDEQYEKLGALLYRRFQNGEESGEEEAAIIAAIDELLARLDALKKEGCAAEAEETAETAQTDESAAAEAAEETDATDGEAPQA